MTNYYFDDTWQYNITSNRWRRMSAFVYAKYPESCTDDLAARKLEHSGNYKAFIPPAGLADDLDGYFLIKERHYGTLKVSHDHGLSQDLCLRWLRIREGIAASSGQDTGRHAIG